MKMYRGLIFFMVMVARLFTNTLGKLQLDCTRWVAPALPPSQHRSTLRLRGGETQSEKEAQIRQAVKAAVAARMDAANHGDTYQDDGPRPEQDHRKNVHSQTGHSDGEKNSNGYDTQKENSHSGGDTDNHKREHKQGSNDAPKNEHKEGGDIGQKKEKKDDSHDGPKDEQKNGGHDAPKKEQKDGGHDAPKNEKKEGGHDAPKKEQKESSNEAPKKKEHKEGGDHDAPKKELKDSSNEAPKKKERKEGGDHDAPKKENKEGDHKAPKNDQKDGDHDAPKKEQKDHDAPKKEQKNDSVDGPKKEQKNADQKAPKLEKKEGGHGKNGGDQETKHSSEGPAAAVAKQHSKTSDVNATKNSVIQAAIWAPLAFMMVARPLGIDLSEIMDTLADLYASISKRKKPRDEIPRGPILGAIAAIGVALFGWIM